MTSRLSHLLLLSGSKDLSENLFWDKSLRRGWWRLRDHRRSKMTVREIIIYSDDLLKKATAPQKFLARARILFAAKAKRQPQGNLQYCYMYLEYVWNLYDKNKKLGRALFVEVSARLFHLIRIYSPCFMTYSSHTVFPSSCVIFSKLEYVPETVSNFKIGISLLTRVLPSI